MLPPGFTLLQVTPALDAGGVERTTLDVSDAVVAAGGRSVVASAGGRLEGELEAGGGALQRLPVDSKAPHTVLLNVLRLRALIRRERPSIVHARSRMCAWSALLAARAERTPFVTTYAGAYGGRSGLKRLYNSVMARGDLVIANSAWTADRLLQVHGTDPARVVTIPRGVDLRRFDPAAVSGARMLAARERFGLQPDDRRLVLLLAARLTRWKGQAFMLEAFAAAREQGLDAVLVLAGDDQGRTGYLQGLQRRIAELGLADAVTLAGHLEDMAAAYAACDVALAPSLEPEAFGRTAVEPQAMARPVIVADHGAPAETVQPGVGGWRAPPGDVRAWTAALLHAARLDPFERRRMGAAGRTQVAARYGLKAMTDATLAAYVRLLEAHRGEPA